MLAVASLAGPARAGIAVPPAPGDWQPAWSPDGTAIVFLSSRDPDTLRVVRPDGGGERRIPVSSGQWPFFNRFAFSPDWYWIAVAPPFPNGSLQLVLPDGTGTSQIVPPGHVVPDLLRWSPDGRSLAFLTPNGAGRPGRLAVVDAASGETRTYRVTPSNFEWAPDSRRIAVVVGSELSILDTVSGTAKVFAHGGYDPAWSPDGTQLAFAAGGVCRDRTGIYRALVVPAPILERLTNDCHLYGTPGPDVIAGSALTDVIVGFGGDDRLTSVGGDTLEGDDGNDALIGSESRDILERRAGQRHPAGRGIGGHADGRIRPRHAERRRRRRRDPCSRRRAGLGLVRNQRGLHDRAERNGHRLRGRA